MKPNLITWSVWDTNTVELKCYLLLSGNEVSSGLGREKKNLTVDCILYLIKWYTKLSHITDTWADQDLHTSACNNCIKVMLCKV